MSNSMTYSSTQEELIHRYSKGREETRKLQLELYKLMQRSVEERKPFTDRQRKRFNHFLKLFDWSYKVDYTLFYTEEGVPKNINFSNDCFNLKDIIESFPDKLNPVSYTHLRAHET